MASFRHSGKLGDIVYSLPCVRLLGQGRYYIRLGDPLTESEANVILPLLRAQSYIEEATIWANQEFEHDLDRFRKLHPMWTNLADCHLFALGLASFPRNRKWLEAPDPLNPPQPVAISRSDSFRGAPGFWEEVYSLVAERAFFVGTRKEHADFESLLGPIEYVRTRDLLELARLLAGANLFIGNQSCPYAIAEGLKIPCIQEVYHFTPNCIFDRPNAVHVWEASEVGPAIARLMPITP